MSDRSGRDDGVDDGRVSGGIEVHLFCVHLLSEGRGGAGAGGGACVNGGLLMERKAEKGIQRKEGGRKEEGRRKCHTFHYLIQIVSLGR